MAGTIDVWASAKEIAAPLRISSVRVGCGRSSGVTVRRLAPIRTPESGYAERSRATPGGGSGARVAEVRQIDDTHLHWVAELGGTRHEWDAEITEQTPDQRVAWKNVDGKDNAGVVTFHRLDDEVTRIMAQLDFVPEGVKEKLGDLLGAPDRRVQGDLQRFKAFIEERGSETGAWRGEVEQTAR